jgi:hypothetical protein
MVMGVGVDDEAVSAAAANPPDCPAQVIAAQQTTTLL